MNTNVNPVAGLREKRAAQRDIYKMMIPSVVQNLLDMSVSLVMTALVGRLLSQDISAQGMSNQITFTIWGLIKGVGIGLTIFIGNQYGAKNLSACRKTAEQGYLSLVPLSILLSAGVLLLERPLLGLMSSEPALLELAGSYLRIAVWMLPGYAVMTVNTSSFNGIGNTKTPMYISTVCNIVNIPVAYCLIFGIGGSGGLGVRGAAVSTVLAYTANALVGLFFLWRRRGGSYAGFPREKTGRLVELSYWKEIYRRGVPASADGVLWQLAAIVITGAILAYGSETYAAYQLGYEAEKFLMAPATGFSIAATALASIAIGAGDKALYQSYYREIVKMGVAAAGLTTALLLVGGRVALGLLTDIPEVQVIGAAYLRLMAIGQVPQVLCWIFKGFIRAAGFNRFPMLSSAVGLWLVRVPAILLVTRVLKLNIAWAWLFISMDHMVRLVLDYGYVRRKKLFTEE